MNNRGYCLPQKNFKADIMSQSSPALYASCNNCFDKLSTKRAANDKFQFIILVPLSFNDSKLKPEPALFSLQNSQFRRLVESFAAWEAKILWNVTVAHQHSTNGFISNFKRTLNENCFLYGASCCLWYLLQLGICGIVMSLLWLGIFQIAVA